MSIELEVRRLRCTVVAAEDRLRELHGQDAHAANLPNALLILAVQRMVERDGAAIAATVLRRLADTVVAGPAPPPERAVDLSSLNS